MQQQSVYEESLTSKGWKWFGKVLAIGIILVVAGFGDIMYIQLMNGKFPSGPLLVLCYIGAFSSFLAVVYMLIGKSVLFTPGKQMIVAWLVFVAELAIIALNIILVFQGVQHQEGFLLVWYELSPTTPVLNMIGVAILYFLDEEQAEKHEDMELQLHMNKAERTYTKAMHKARLGLKYKQLQYTVSALEQAVNSPESLSFIEQTAYDLNAGLLSEFSGRSYGYQHTPRMSRLNGAKEGVTELAPQEAAKLDEKAVESTQEQTAPKKKGFPFIGGLFGDGKKESVPVVDQASAPTPATRRPFIPTIKEELQPSAAQQVRERRTARRHRRQSANSFRAG